jgi:methionine synthase I (cobalamin-dependent)
MCSLAENEEGRASLIAAGACGALVEALTIAEADDTRCSIAFAMTSFAESEQGRTSLISGGACGALVEALKVADDIDTIRNATKKLLSKMTMLGEALPCISLRGRNKCKAAAARMQRVGSEGSRG